MAHLSPLCVGPIWDQWRNGGGEGPQRLLTGKFLLTYQEKRGKKKRGRVENGEEKKEIVKGKVGNWKWKEKMRRGPLLFFFFFFALHFSKPLKFVLGLPKWKFSTRKQHFTPGNKSRKITLPPQKNFPVMPLFGTVAKYPIQIQIQKSDIVRWLIIGNGQSQIIMAVHNDSYPQTTETITPWGKPWKGHQEVIE